MIIDIFFSYFHLLSSPPVLCPLFRQAHEFGVGVGGGCGRELQRGYLSAREGWRSGRSQFKKEKEKEEEEKICTRGIFFFFEIDSIFFSFTLFYFIVIRTYTCTYTRIPASTRTPTQAYA